MKTKKNILKKFLSVIMVIVMTVGIAPLNGFVGLELPSFADLFSVKVEAESYNGTCGYNLTWELDIDTGVLTISGTGAMRDYWTWLLGMAIVQVSNLLRLVTG